MESSGVLGTQKCNDLFLDKVLSIILQLKTNLFVLKNYLLEQNVFKNCYTFVWMSGLQNSLEYTSVNEIPVFEDISKGKKLNQLIACDVEAVALPWEPKIDSSGHFSNWIDTEKWSRGSQTHPVISKVHNQ